MKENFFEPLAEGCLGALFLFIDVVAAPFRVLKAFAMRSPNEVLYRPRIR